MSNESLMRSAKIAITDCMAVKLNEKLLIVTDTELEPIGKILFAAGLELGINTAMTLMPVLETHGTDAPAHVEAAMLKAHAVICATATSLTHTGSRRRACEAGSRVATMPGITAEILERGLGADYDAIAERTIKVTALLDKANVARVTTALGTDMTIPIDGINAISSTGLIRNPGDFGNLPSGESYMMPKEGASNGVIIVDGSFSGIGKMPKGETVKMVVEDGYVTSIEGGSAAAKLIELLEPHGKLGHNLAELGVGTNDSAQICGLILEDEKVMGTIHLAVGNNKSMGGTIGPKIHLDGIVNNPTVLLDGEPLLVNGQLQLG
jgi:leucyl aminopeptidase (aminopeptidase T)